ncbi:unnamed protein product [Rangifer tarandus platyrhynchus]|uniref:Uncharacterized protein n=2 Tax=Rangifer tarandus platyrhynchus TaxID=3082113 RepID=A0AC59YEW2_RANTA|nr:unnamed protein product [Rangifer tarandus platyrhynchus]
MEMEVKTTQWEAEMVDPGFPPEPRSLHLPPLLCTPCRSSQPTHQDCSPPGSSVHEIIQARHWSGLPFSSPGDLPGPGIEPGSPALQVDSLPSDPGKPLFFFFLIDSFLEQF